MYNRFDNTKRCKTINEVVQGNATKLSKEEQEGYIRKLNKYNYGWGTDSPTHLELEGKKYTLGFELETIDGSIPEDVWTKYNMAAVHDGSLRGPNGEDPEGGEYVTGVLYGDMGFKHLHSICNVLQKYTEIDKRCGVHIHIGNMNWSDEDVLYAYILACMIEKEAFSLLPPSRRSNSFCRPLDNRAEYYLQELRKNRQDRIQYKLTVEELYNDLFMYVSGGVPQSPRCNKNTNHPKGSKCGYSKSSQRYCWINFVTLIFQTKSASNSKTLEIRSHGATLNYNKIKNWTKIWVAFVEFVTNNKTDILDGKVTLSNGNYPISLETMVLLSFKKSGAKLVEFMRSRKIAFKSKGEEIDYEKSTDLNDKQLKEIIRN